VENWIHRGFFGAGIFLFLLLPIQSAEASCLTPAGDINQSTEADVGDVQCLILTTLWELSGGDGPAPGCVTVTLGGADLNCDGSRSVIDVLLSIQLALGQSLSPLVDADGDDCVDTCLAGSDCCEIHDYDGCTQPTCESCVCDLDDYCCLASWDEWCAYTAEVSCAEECACAPTCGDGSCDLPETCGTCPEDCGACTEDCCSVREDPGCDQISCESCVCEEDAYCCELGWDAACLEIVLDTELCASDCT
jgi:hypothetical protein